MKDHQAEYQHDEALEYENLATQAAIYDRAESARRAKNDIYMNYIALAVIGDFKAELVDQQEPTAEGFGKHVRKAYLIDASNGVILTELAAPWKTVTSAATLNEPPSSESTEQQP